MAMKINQTTEPLRINTRKVAFYGGNIEVTEIIMYKPNEENDVAITSVTGTVRRGESMAAPDGVLAVLKNLNIELLHRRATAKECLALYDAIADISELIEASRDALAGLSTDMRGADRDAFDRLRGALEKM